MGPILIVQYSDFEYQDQAQPTPATTTTTISYTQVYRIATIVLCDDDDVGATREQKPQKSFPPARQGPNSFSPTGWLAPRKCHDFSYDSVVAATCRVQQYTCSMQYAVVQHGG